MGRWIFRLTTFLLVIFAAFGISTGAIAEEPLKVAFVYVGPIGDAGWTYAHDQGRIALEKALGSKVKTSYVESVPESADAERVIRKLAADGNKLIFTTSFGYMNPTLKVAQSFPNTIFMHATGYKTAKNVGVYQARFYEGGYLAGVLAGKMSKSGTIGFVGSYPIPAVIRNIDAYTLGARSVNPKIKTKVIWVNSWYDPGKERQASETLVAQGADVLCQSTNSPAVLQVAQEKGVYAFGWDSDMVKFAPRAQLTASVLNWGDYYIEVAKQVLSGTWKTQNITNGVKEGMVVMAPLNSAVPADVAKLFEEKKRALIKGKLHPFQGPVYDQVGNIKVAAGAVLPLTDLMSINWYVEGVEGSIPR
ncbi:MAG TPA: BMP family ABC transporter substrate-binding protein [Burkholderiales bacterium]|nr:BMP family ABC transporter substrate-binding protein [Burkholderiales bacterium]